MNPQLQLLVALQDMEGMIKEVETQGEELEGMGFSQSGIEDLKSARDELAGNIDPRHMSWYRRLTEKHGHAVVPVVKNLCTGCFANIPAQFVSKTNISKVQKYESCGRILYWP